ncbi:MAG: hypothetical protein ABIQ47_11505 [Tepidiformaceae bacterium]
MTDDLVTFKLEGPITLDAFREALARFHELATAVAEEVAPEQPFEWIIEELQAGSAGAAFQTRTARAEYGAEVRRGISTALDAAKESKIVPFNLRVARAARSVIALVGKEAEGLAVTTEYGAIDVVVPVLLSAPRQTATVASYGVIKGEVDALVRSKARFVIFAEPDSRVVNCYLGRDEEVDAVMSTLYGQRVRVTGDIERNRHSGRIVRVQHVKTAGVEILRRDRPDFERALGAFRVPSSTPPPEERRAKWDD